MAARVPTGKPRGRPRGSAKVAGSGRVAKSLDRGERLVVNAQMAGDILAVYARLGGADFLFKWAKENPSLYVTNVLSKLMPAAPKDDPDIQINQQFNGGVSEMEAARRVAFALAKAAYQLQDEEPAAIEAEVTPEDPTKWRAPSDAPDMVPEFEDRPLFQPDRGEPVQTSLETYHGGSGEQGGSVSRPTVQPKRSAAELCRSLSRRGRDLM